MSSILGKRQLIQQSDFSGEEEKIDFLKKYLPELLKENQRVKYYMNFEFPQKQKILLDYWKRALDLFFQFNKFGCVCPYSYLNEMFNVENSYPLGLEKIVGSLGNAGDIVILNGIENFEPLADFMSNLEKKSTLKKVFNLFNNIFSVKDSQNLKGTGKILVYTSIFMKLYHSLTSKLPNVFVLKPALTSEELFDVLKFQYHLKELEIHLIIEISLIKGLLGKRKVEKFTFYFINDSDLNNLEIEAIIQEKLLISKLEVFNNKISELSFKIEDLNSLLLKLKKANKKQEALMKLSNRKILLSQLEKVNSRKLYLESMLYKIQHTKDEKELFDVLKNVNSYMDKHLKDNKLDNFYDHIDNIREFDEKSKAIDEVIKDLSHNQELDSMYDNLENDKEFHIRGVSLIPVKSNEDMMILNFEENNISDKKGEQMKEYDEQIRKLLE